MKINQKLTKNYLSIGLVFLTVSLSSCNKTEITPRVDESSETTYVRSLINPKSIITIDEYYAELEIINAYGLKSDPIEPQPKGYADCWKKVDGVSKQGKICLTGSGSDCTVASVCEVK